METLEQLERLADLKDKGHISEDEFQFQKQKLLNLQPHPVPHFIPAQQGSLDKAWYYESGPKS